MEEVRHTIVECNGTIEPLGVQKWQPFLFALPLNRVRVRTIQTKMSINVIAKKLRMVQFHFSIEHISLPKSGCEWNCMGSYGQRHSLNWFTTSISWCCIPFGIWFLKKSPHCMHFISHGNRKLSSKLRNESLSAWINFHESDNYVLRRKWLTRNRKIAFSEFLAFPTHCTSHFHFTWICKCKWINKKKIEVSHKLILPLEKLPFSAQCKLFIYKSIFFNLHCTASHRSNEHYSLDRHDRAE